MNHQSRFYFQANKLIGSLLPNTVMSSGSEEKVAKIFPKIIQTDKKQIFSFPILLGSFCYFFLEYPELKVALGVGGPAVFPRV